VAFQAARKRGHNLWRPVSRGGFRAPWLDRSGPGCRGGPFKRVLDKNPPCVQDLHGQACAGGAGIAAVIAGGTVIAASLQLQ
jgi:hypothetical protein